LIYKSCAIIAGAPDGILGDTADSYVICADSGCEHAKRLGARCDLYVGDGDSASIPKDTETSVFPAEKDDSDLALAVDAALAKGFTLIDIYFATGGRFDHYLANVCLLERIYDAGAKGRIIDRNNIIMFIAAGTTEVEDEGFVYISLLPLDEKLEGVTYSGLKYSLDNADISRKNPIAISNVFTAPSAKITIRRGRGLLVLSRD
jgi:thiamine pyrophosphokinase